MASLGFNVVGSAADGVFYNSAGRYNYARISIEDSDLKSDIVLEFPTLDDLTGHLGECEDLRKKWHERTNLGPTPLQIVHGALIDAWHLMWAEFGDGTEPDILDSMRRTRDALVALEDHYDLSADEARAAQDFAIIERLYAGYGLDVPAPGTEPQKAVAA